MLSAVRRRLTWANAAMTLALVFAMSGGAYAAKKYLITNTRQISPKVLKQLKGAKGPAGPAGPQGPAGAKGENGALGAAGEKGASGANGKSVLAAAEAKGANCKEGGSSFEVEGSGKKVFACNGLEGKEGKQGLQGNPGESVTSAALSKGDATCKEGGSKFTVGGKETFACNGANGQSGFTETLPAGKTETGTWAVNEPAGAFNVTALSFNIPLAGNGLDSSHVFYVPAGNTTTEHCSASAPNGPGGSGAKPKADPNYLCVYEGIGINVKNGGVNTPEFGAGFLATGGILDLGATSSTEPVIGLGSWAVTAPNPVITEVTPNKGAAAGGNTVTIKGASLQSGGVKFGTESTPNPTYKGGGSEIEIKVPPGTAGQTVDVTVEVSGYTNAITAADHYTYE